MRVLGLDLSLTSTGIAAIEDGKLVRAGYIRAGERREAARLEHIVTGIFSFVREIGWEGFTAGYNDYQVAIEGYAYSRILSQQHSTGELGGVVRLELHRAGIEYHVFGPGVWRKVVLGNGKFDKTQVRLEVFKRFAGLEIASHDALEAFCVAQCLYLTATGQAKPRAVPIRKKKVAA
jgi:crossover junction endodeoxyribonuclease RuvC